MYNNLSAFVETKEEGERAVAMFTQGAKLDYRPQEPNWIQVKVGACDTHLENLVWLLDMIEESKGICAETVYICSDETIHLCSRVDSEE